MKEHYLKPEICSLEISLEGAAMLTQSSFDSKFNTENLGWDDVVEF